MCMSFYPAGLALQVLRLPQRHQSALGISPNGAQDSLVLLVLLLSPLFIDGSGLVLCQYTVCLTLLVLVLVLLQSPLKLVVEGWCSRGHGVQVCLTQHMPAQ